MEVEAKKREENLKIYVQRETDVQRFWLAAPCFLPTAHIVFLKVVPGQNFFSNCF